MASYKLTITTAERENYFKVTWEDIDKGTRNFFEEPAPAILGKQLEKLWERKQLQLDSGSLEGLRNRLLQDKYDVILSSLYAPHRNLDHR
ncbi:MAG: hypothetical protein GY765_36840 [bacterium]|nr:hypothetical protein [bacterium]